MSINVLLADDHPIVRDGIKKLLEKEERLRTVGEAADGQEAVRLAEQLQPDLAILDLSMPVLNGLDAVRAIQKDSPKTRTLLLSVHSEEAYVVQALQLGVQGYLVKTQAAGDILRAIREILDGRIYLSPCISRTVVEAGLAQMTPPADALSSRERQVLQLVAEGKLSKEIADVLSVSVRTAEAHRARIRMKLGVRSTAGLVRYAVRRGMVKP